MRAAFKDGGIICLGFGKELLFRGNALTLRAAEAAAVELFDRRFDRDGARPQPAALLREVVESEYATGVTISVSSSDSD